MKGNFHSIFNLSLFPFKGEESRYGIRYKMNGNFHSFYIFYTLMEYLVYKDIPDVSVSDLVSSPGTRHWPRRACRGCSQRRTSSGGRRRGLHYRPPPLCRGDTSRTKNISVIKKNSVVKIILENILVLGLSPVEVVNVVGLVVAPAPR